MKQVPKASFLLVSSTSYISIGGCHSLKMINNTKLDENIEGDENFIAWKYRVMIILKEHDLEGYIKEEVQEAIFLLVSSTSYISIWGYQSLKMTNNNKLDENIEGEKNLREWNYRVMLILEEHDLEGYIKYEVKEPEEDYAK